MILLIDFGSSKAPLIEDAISKFADVQRVGYLDFDDKDLINYNGIVLSGAPILLSQIDYSKYVKDFQWLLSYDKPVLGICFGHQLLGLLHGASVALQREDRDLQWIEVIAQNPLFDDVENPVQMMEDHCESISIPPGFELSATSDYTVNEAMHHKSKPFFGVQFHPEVSGKAGELLLENFCNLVKIYKQ
jgi:GMP synthase (glutamine-hydrolysing)